VLCIIRSTERNNRTKERTNDTQLYFSIFVALQCPSNRRTLLYTKQRSFRCFAFCLYL